MLSPNVGRALGIAGAVILLVAFFLPWYDITFADGATETSTGWQTFIRLRWVVLVGCLLVIASALVRQVRLVLVARVVIGLVLAALVIRRIIDPPEEGTALATLFGVYVGAVGALVMAVGGLVDAGRTAVEVYPGLVRQRRPELTAGDRERGLPPGDDAR